MKNGDGRTRPVPLCPTTTDAATREGVVHAWMLRGMVDREKSGVVGGNMGVSRSYVIYMVITLQESQVRELLSSDRFTVIVNGLRERYRGTGGSETIHRMRVFLNGGT